MDAQNAVKAFIVDNDKLFIAKRCSDEDESPDIWEIPGGRLNIGENPREGLVREVKEETGLDIEVLNPLNVQHFRRACGTMITMIIFFCRPISSNIILSDEHSDYLWVDLNLAKEKLTHFFHEEIDIYNKLFRKID